MFFTILLFAIPLLIVLDYTSKKRRYALTKDLPGPKILPVFGSSVAFHQKTMKDAMYFMKNNVDKYGPLLRLWMFHKLVILCINPKQLEVLLSSTKHITKNSLYQFLDTWLGSGLLLSSGQKWFSRRKVITPTFHFKILEQFVEIFDQQSAILVEKLKVHSGGNGFNISPYVTLAALDVVCETAMGTKVNAQNDPNNEYVVAVSDITNILSNRFANGLYFNDTIFSILSPYQKRRQSECVKILHAFTEKIIKEHRSALLKNKAEQQCHEDDDIGTKKKMALLDVLLQSTINGKPLSNEDIREEVDTFMFEGHDTTTSGICFALYCISRHPKVQQKLFEEIHRVIGDDMSKPITYRDLQELKYMECAIKEALRLYPSVPVIGRHLLEDLEIDGKIFPAGADVVIPMYLLMRNPEIYPNPEGYIPERYAVDKTTEKGNSYAYIPFSAGPRNCIGQKFAMLEMKSTISKILRYFELLPMGPEPDVVINIVLKSLNGINIGIKERVY